MSFRKRSVATDSTIKLRGVRQHNLKNLNLDLPLFRLIAISGVSGSGKSSLALHTLYAEGQRRYVETFSPYARQFLERMDPPQADQIEGIPPAIAIESGNVVRSSRSTVGTITEINDYLKTLYARLAIPHCPGCHAAGPARPSGHGLAETAGPSPGKPSSHHFPLSSQAVIGLAAASDLPGVPARLCRGESPRSRNSGTRYPFATGNRRNSGGH